MNKILIFALILFLLVFSFLLVDLQLSMLFEQDNLKSMISFFAEFFPPHKEIQFLKLVIIALWETLAISVLGTVLAAIFGLFLVGFRSKT